MKIDWSSCSITLGKVGRSRWARGQPMGHTWEPPGREIQGFLLIVICAGRGRFRLRQGWVPLQPGVCLWLRPGYRYAATQDPDDPVHQNFLQFDLVATRGRTRARNAVLPPEFIEPPDPEFAEVVTRRIVELCYGFDPMGHASPPYKDDVARLANAMFIPLLMELDAATDRPADLRMPAVTPHYEQMVRQAVLHIAENAHDTPSVAELARRSRYSVSRFSRIFKLVTGESPERFIVCTRLHRAERLLRETSLPVGEVAEAAGYRNIYFFSHQFKKFNQISPMHFRRQHQAKQTKEKRSRNIAHGTHRIH